VRPGFVAGKPRERDFRQALDHEVARMERFLSPVRAGQRRAGSQPTGPIII